jgi:dihydroflavonol-4-reductase
MSPSAAHRIWAGRRVAVTGASGFIGYHVARELVRRGADVLALVRRGSAVARLRSAGVRIAEAPLDDSGALARGCDGREFVFHLAGAVDFENDWDRFRRVNVEGTRNVLAAARAAGVRRVVHTSSIVAVGATSEPGVLDETAAWDLGSLRVPYVTTKRQAEEEALTAVGPEVVVVNPACVVGPEDYGRSEFGTFCRRFWRGRIPFDFGGGNNFVDVRDAAAGHLLAAERGRPGERYILGGCNRTTTAFFADLARVAGRPIFRLRLPAALGGLVATLNDRFGVWRAARSYLTAGQARLLGLFFYYDCGKAHRELGYRPRSLRASLADSHAFWMGEASCNPTGPSGPAGRSA